MSTENRETDPIAEPRRRLNAAFLKGDVATILSIYSDTAVLMAPNEPSLFGKNEIEEWHQEYFAAFRLVTLEVTEHEVTMLDGWAIERWAYLVAIESLNGVDRIRDDGRFLTVWKKEGMDWRIQQSMFNSIRPIGSGTSRFLVRLKKKSDQ
jgi:ketosteroid isomerase-like protein